MINKVLIKRLDDKAVLPSKTHLTDYCYDLVAVSEEEIAPNVWKYGFGFALQLDRSEQEETDDLLEGYIPCFTIRPRSSVHKAGMVLSNSVGVIDQDYTGEISAVFYHVLPQTPRYKVGDRIAQLCLECTKVLNFFEVDELRKTERGAGGYGSTDTTKKNENE